MNELAKSQVDICVHPEVSEKLVQILHNRSLCEEQCWDLSVAQKILAEMHILEINEI